MKGNKSLSGRIIVAHPKLEEPYFSKGVIILSKHSNSGAWGLMVNKPAPKTTIDQIMQSVGIMCNRQDKIYIGGPVDTHRVYVLHTLDWRSSTTMKITDDIGISNDVSILSAIATGEGPALFRACVGNCQWAPGQLDGEMSGEMPWHQNTSWLDTPATIESVFNLTEEEQWQRAIELVAHDKVSSWL
jgi:putative transcriptional regulator